MNLFASIVHSVGGALYSYIIAIAIIIIGAAVALKAGNKIGWVVLGGGVLWIIATMKVQGLS